MNDDTVASECDLVVVKFDVEAKSKSSISPDEVKVNDLNLYAFCDGKLVVYDYFTDGVQPQLKLLRGLRYDLYALANVGVVEAPVDEDVFCQQCECSISRIENMQDGLPMVWQYDDFEVRTLYDRVRVDLRRMVSKVIFSVDKSALDGLQVDAVRLCQSPCKVWPFRYEYGSRISDSDDAVDGDYASANDLDVLNEGGQICFYALENCQGRLLEGNQDPWGKIPENIPMMSELCTYLEVQCSFKEGFFYSGNVTYRLYLGMDSVSDFNLPGNSVVGVSLYLTDDAIRQMSWRVEPDVSVNDGYAHGWLSSGRHSISDLYVGERFVYTLLLTEKMMTHLDGCPGNARLCVWCDEGQLLEIGDIVDAGPSGNGRFLNVDVLCLNEGEGVLCLMDDDGRELAVFDDFRVQSPKVRVSDTASYDDGEIVQSDLGLLNIPVNQKENSFFVYLVDNEGYNLNASEGPGFELSLFDFQPGVNGVSSEIAGQLECRTEPGKSGSGGSSFTCSLYCGNDGSSHSLNAELTELVSNGNIVELVLADSDHSLSTKVKFTLDCLPVTFTLVDNGWAGYDDCQISMLVDNPSNLILDVQCWQVNKADAAYDGAARNEIAGLYGKDFSRTVYDYVCGAFSPGKRPLYCSKSSFRSDRSDKDVIEDDGRLVYPLKELSTDLIYYALLYDYLGQDALYHCVDAVFGTGRRFNEFSLVDSLSNGSPAYNVIYGHASDMPGWNDRGVWMYSDGVSIHKSGNDFDEYPGMTPVSLSVLDSGTMGEISVTFDSGSKCFRACVSSNELAGVIFNTEIEVKASGYVQTTPNGTWGKKVDNYCSSRVSKVVDEVVLGLTPTAMDGNALVEAMNAIYSQTFTDSKNMIGSANSYAHRAHPTSLDVTLRFSLGGEYSDSMVPIEITTPSSLSFYHSQDAVTYNVSIGSTKTVNRVAIVKNLKENQ